MKRWILWAVLGGCSATLNDGQAAILPGNFLPNPDIETDANRDGRPDDWVPGGNVRGGTVWDTSRPAGGSRNLLLNDNSGSGFASWSTTARLPMPTDELEFQWSWAYDFVSQQPDNGFRMTVTWLSSGIDLGQTDFLVQEDQLELVEINKLLVVPEETDSLRIDFLTGPSPDVTGRLYVDEVSVSIPGAGRFGDLNGDGRLDAGDIDLLSRKVREGNNEPYFDLNSDSRVDQADREFWVDWIKISYFGDANMDFKFDSSDLIVVFQAGQYEDSQVANSTWATGDWNGDLEFDASDVVLAFQSGGFEQGYRSAVAVPEPAGNLLASLAGCGLVVLGRGRTLRCGQRRACVTGADSRTK